MARTAMELVAVSGNGLQTAAWFSACGLPLESSDLSEARAYLSALQMPAAMPVLPVASWEHAERLIRNPSWDTRWWNSEDAERRRLYGECVSRLGEAATMTRLSIASGVESEVIHGSAAVAAAQKGCADSALIRAAAGAASMAAYEARLARLAGCANDHLFVRKYFMFEGGRWPLGIVSGALHVF